MPSALPQKLNVMLMTPTTDATRERIRAVSPEALQVIDLWPDIFTEVSREWSPTWMNRFSSTKPQATRTAGETESLIRQAHVLLVGLPYPKTIPGRASSLIWAHFPFAGTSNLWGSDWWGARFMVSSSRGMTGALPIAETAVAAAVMIAKQLDDAVTKAAVGDFDPRPYSGSMRLIAGKTMGVIGLGGIGQHIARISRGWGMRVIATRHSATQRQSNVDGVDELYPASDLHHLLAQSDFIAVCPILTRETERMINAAAFAASKPGAILLNIARGEVIDNDALAAALHSGQLSGAYLDTWDDDVNSPPPPVLLAAPNIVYTPHISGQSDENHAFGIDLFCNNLARLLRGEELINVIDWQRGY